MKFGIANAIRNHPARAYALADVYREAGLPAGALNVVTGFGDRIGDSLTTHPLVKAVCEVLGAVVARVRLDGDPT